MQYTSSGLEVLLFAVICVAAQSHEQQILRFTQRYFYLIYALYTTMSALSLALLSLAFYKKHQFYAAMVYLTRWPFANVVFHIEILLSLVILSKLLIKIYLGKLLSVEYDSLVQRMVRDLIELGLRLAFFFDLKRKDDELIIYFACLYMVKSFHFIAAKRVDILRRGQLPLPFLNLRIALLWIGLICIDLNIISYLYDSVLSHSINEWHIAVTAQWSYFSVSVLRTAYQHIILILELRFGYHLRDAAMIERCVLLFLNAIKLLLDFSIVVVVILDMQTLPLFIVYPMLFTIIHVLDGFKHLFDSLQLMRMLRYNIPNATALDMERSGSDTCVICLETMIPGTAKILPCKHIFHKSCLRSWVIRHRNCPVCRYDLIQRRPRRQSNINRAAQSIRSMLQQRLARRLQQRNGRATGATAAAAPPSPMNLASASATSSPLPSGDLCLNCMLRRMLPQPLLLSTPAFIPMRAPPIDLSGLNMEQLIAMENNLKTEIQQRLQTLLPIRDQINAIEQLMLIYNNIATQNTAEMRQNNN